MTIKAFPCKDQKWKQQFVSFFEILQTFFFFFCEILQALKKWENENSPLLHLNLKWGKVE